MTGTENRMSIEYICTVPFRMYNFAYKIKNKDIISRNLNSGEFKLSSQPYI